MGLIPELHQGEEGERGDEGRQVHFPVTRDASNKILLNPMMLSYLISKSRFVGLRESKPGFSLKWIPKVTDCSRRGLGHRSRGTPQSWGRRDRKLHTGIVLRGWASAHRWFQGEPLGPWASGEIIIQFYKMIARLGSGEAAESVGRCSSAFVIHMDGYAANSYMGTRVELEP